MKIEIVLSGVGGQGVITMGMVLGDACIKRGVNIVTAETHGMAQRMGAVEFFIRIGDVEAPLVPIASADYVVALEMIESLRAVRYLKKCGWMVLSNVYLPPPNANRVPSRKDVVEALAKLPIKMVLVDAEGIARRLGDPRVVNMAMLGALLAFEDVSKVVPVHVAEDVVQKTLGDVNREALIMGYEEALKKLSKGIDTYISKSCTD